MGARRSRRGVRSALSVGLLASVLGVVGFSASSGATPPTESGSWTQVSAGGFTTCGIRLPGRLYCWGSDGYGQVGNGGHDDLYDTEPMPAEVFGLHDDWRQVSVGSRNACGIRAGGHLYCWGDDGYGVTFPHASDQLGVPIEAPGGAAHWVSVSVGNLHACARKSTGHLFCWGYDAHGELGNGPSSTRTRRSPVEVAGHDDDWASVDAGGAHTCARKTSGRLYCWGLNEAGQLGNGATAAYLDDPEHAPDQVFGNLSNWGSAIAGGQTTCARRVNGRLWCWGADEYGQLGNGRTNVNRSVPVEVAGDATDWASVVTGDLHSCGRRTTGRLFCWGAGEHGQLGGGAPIAERRAPVEVVGHTTDWASVTVGTAHTCARKADGHLYCWGRDAAGQLGNGGTTTDDQSTPVEVGDVVIIDT